MVLGREGWKGCPLKLYFSLDIHYFVLYYLLSSQNSFLSSELASYTGIPFQLQPGALLPMREKNHVTVVPAVDRAVELLVTLAEAKQALMLTELTDRTSMSPSTAFNTLAALQTHGLVQKDERYKTYRLGIKVFELGRAYIEQVSLIPAFNEIAHELVRQCWETVKLVVRDERDVIYLARVEGEHSLRLVAREGTRMPAHVTAVGKVLLAQLDDAAVQVLYRGYDFPRRTPHTIESFDELLQQVAAARSQGYAYDNEESSIGVYCVAAPIRDQTNEVIAAMSIGVPDNRLAPGRMDELRAMIVQSAARLSRMLGWIER
jgi:IclR family KDG regulon transcriptional repressor